MAMGLIGHKRIGELLVEKGLCTAEDVKAGLETQKQTERLLGEELVFKKIIKADDLLETLSEQFNLPYMDLMEPNVVNPEVLRKLPEKVCRGFRMAALQEREQGGEKILYVGMANPKNVMALDSIRQILKGVKIQPVLALATHVMKALDTYYTDDAAAGLGDVFDEGADDVDMVRDGEDGDGVDVSDHDAAPVIRYVNGLFVRAVKDRCSDIHIECYEKELRVRFRIDGKLQVKDKPPTRMRNAIIARIKVISGLDIAERRLPQDGRTKVRLMNREIDIRVSTLPMIHGEKVVMRLLDKTATSLNVNDMGMEPEVLEKCLKLIRRPYGIIVLCGPTGSGKTTTLYSFLSVVNEPDTNIVTVENPVEYQLFGINQCQVRQEIGMTFAAGLRSILRQDPDIVMVGEIRDMETLEMSMKAALTGHLVFSTIHTNNGVATVQRMINMGAEPFLVSSTLTASISQRLVRKICPVCKRADNPPADMIKALQERFNDPCDFKFMRGTGCDNCANTGNRGRAASHELYFVGSIQRDMIAAGATEQELAAQAKKDGMQTIVENAFLKVRRGEINVDECLALFYDDDDV
ncbi:MAG: GspE/PulE family protein [Planctomycetota bacterium]